MVDLASKKFILIGIIILFFISFGGYAIYYYSSDTEKDWTSYDCKRGSPDYQSCSTIKYIKMKKELDKLAVLGEGEICGSNNNLPLEKQLQFKVESCKPGYRCKERNAISDGGVCVKESKTSDYDTR